MRIAKIGAGLVLAGALALTACSSGGDKPATPSATETSASGEATSPAAADETTAAAEETTSAAAGADCPALAEGVSIDSGQLSTCASVDVDKVKGYAATMSMLGMNFQVKANPAEKEFAGEIAGMGSFVAIGDKTWVKTTGDWAVGDPNSTDPVVANLSKQAADAATAGDSLSSLTESAGAGAGVALTVTGTEQKLGQDVFVLTGTQESNGTSMDATYYVTKDYFPVGYEMTGDIGGSTMTMKFEITELDKKQDITAPM